METNGEDIGVTRFEHEAADSPYVTIPSLPPVTPL
jgi:hypothetical protein